MYTPEMKEKFVNLRAKGNTISAISEKLGVGRQTLITWNKEYATEIMNLRELELEDHKDKYFANHKKRIEIIGTKFAQLLERVDKQLNDNYEYISPERTLNLLLKYARFLRMEEISLSSELKKESIAKEELEAN